MDSPVEPGITREALLAWLRDKLKAAESALAAREQMAGAWRQGDDKSWREASMLHPSTAGKAPSRKARMKAASVQDRIVVKCRTDVEMFRHAIASLTGREGGHFLSERNTASIADKAEGAGVKVGLFQNPPEHE